MTQCQSRARLILEFHGNRDESQTGEKKWTNLLGKIRGGAYIFFHFLLLLNSVYTVLPLSRGIDRG